MWFELLVLCLGIASSAPSASGNFAISEFQRVEFPDQDRYFRVEIIYQSQEFQQNSVLLLNLPGVESGDGRNDVRNIKMLLNIVNLEYCDVECIFRVTEKDSTQGRGVIVNFRTLGCKNLFLAPASVNKIAKTITYKDVIVQPVRP